MEVFIGFIRKYLGFISIILLTILFAITSTTTAIVFFTVCFLYWMYKGWNHYLILGLLIVLILGDSRLSTLQFMKSIRYITIGLLFIQTTSDILNGKYQLNPIMGWALPFFIIAATGATLSPQIGLSLSKLISYLFLIYIVLQYFYYHILQSNGYLLIHISCLITLVLSIGLLFSISLPDVAWYNGGRFRGIMGNPNGLGIFAALTFPLTVFIKDKYPEYKQLLTTNIILLIISLVLSGSRSSLFSIMIFTIAYFFYSRGALGKWLLWIIAIPITLLVSTIGLETLIYVFNLEKILRIETLFTGSGRLIAWELGIEEWKKSIWIGKGFASDEIFFSSIRQFLITTEHQGGTHNSYISFLMNNGILGLITFIVFIIRLIANSSKNRFVAPFILASLFSSVFESWLVSSLNAFTIFFFLTLIIIEIYPMNKYQI